MCVWISRDCPVTRPGCIPASHPVSAGLVDGWMMVVFTQSNFWQQAVLFHRSLWTALTCFRGYTCASSVILLVHFHLSFFESLSLLPSAGCRQRWEWASEWNHHRVCGTLSWFDGCCKLSLCQSSRMTNTYMTFNGCDVYPISITFATLDIHNKQPHSSTSSSHYLSETYKHKECLAGVLPSPSC